MLERARQKVNRLEREHPRLYASRHVAKGAAQVAVAILGVSLALQFLPGIPLPLPDISPPDIPLPHVSLPEWVRDILATAKFWVPILVGILLAAAELRKRRGRLS
jgi:hypothetical protein